MLLGCATAFFVFRLGSIRSRAQTHAAGQLRIFLQVDDYIDAAKQADKEQRDFLLTGNEKYLDRYTNACRNLKSKLAALQLLAEQGEIYHNETALLTRLAKTELADLDKCIHVQRTQGRPAALALVRQTHAQELLTQIEAQAGKIRAQEQREFDNAASEAEWTANLRNRVFVIGLLFNIFFFWWAYRIITTELEKQQTAARDMAILQSVAVRCTRAGDDFDECLHEILLAANALTNATKGTIRVPDESGTMRIAAQQGFDETFLQKVIDLTKIDARICGVHFQQNQHMGVENVSTSELLRGSPWVELLLSAGVQSFVATPLVSSSGNILGVINTCFPRPGRPTETQMRFLDLLAREAADYLERKEIEKELDNAHAQLGDRAVHLDELVKERTARMQEMITDLEALSYSFVHDMRGPLRAMQTFAEVLKEDCGHLGPVAQNYIHRIQVASQRIDHLIRDGLYYSRFMREDMPLSPLNPKELLLGIIETYPEFEHLQPSIAVCGEFPAVQANEAALTQCFSQLLDNAVKFMPQGKTPAVVVWCEPNKSRVRIFFRDNGVGIKREACHKIFKIFQKLDHDQPGTGIGLAIVKKAVERMGGTVGVVSDPGQGSVFWLELRRSDANPNRKTAVPTLQLAEAI